MMPRTHLGMLRDGDGAMRPVRVTTLASTPPSAVYASCGCPDNQWLVMNEMAGATPRC